MAQDGLGPAAQLLAQGQPARAEALVRQQLERRPDDALGWQLLGLIRLTQGDAAQARAALERSLALEGHSARTLSLLGVACAQTGAPVQSIDCFDRAVALAPDQATLWHDRGKALFEAGRLDEALASFERTLSLARGHAHAWLNRGNVLRDLGRIDAALASLRTAARLAPRDPVVLHALGETLQRARHHPAALDAYDQALALAPGSDGLWASRGAVLLDLKRAADAAEAFERATRLNAASARAWMGHSRALGELGRHAQALASLEQAARLDPGDTSVASALVYLKQQLAHWPGLPALWAQVLAQGDEDRSANACWPLLSHPGASGADQLRGGRAYARTARAGLAPLPALAARPLAHGRLLVGYLSADFRDRPMAHLLAGLFERPGPAPFEVVGIDVHGPGVPDSPMRARLLKAFDRFVDAGDPSLPRVVSQVRALELDILVDLMGVTRHARPELLLHRLAPVQVGYLGYPATTGIDEVDYILGDRWVTPAAEQDSFSERIVTLPDSFQANDDRRAVPAATPARGALGLPEGAFVFCCFNNTYKSLPDTFDVWMRLLRAVPGSVLWLVGDGDGDAATGHFRAEARARGVDPGRLVFAGRKPYAQYLAQYRQADLFLDTLPFNAGTTASDALWAGLPVLTQAGRTFAGRMAASLLDAAGLPELITHSAEDYEALALRLATEPARLRALRGRLEAARSTARLFDTARFTRHLESAFQTMARAHREGRPPAAFAVAPID